MPKYLNSNSTVVTIGQIRLEPNQSVETNTWIPTADLPAGVTQIATTPYLDPMLYSEAVATTKNVAIPATITSNYKIRIYCVGTNSVSFKFNNTVAASHILGSGGVYEIVCAKRIINEILFTIGASTVAYLNIEKG